MKEEWMLISVRYLDYPTCKSHAEMDVKFLKGESCDPESYNYVNGNTNWEKTSIDFETVSFICLQCGQILTF